MDRDCEKRCECYVFSFVFCLSKIESFFTVIIPTYLPTTTQYVFVIMRTTTNVVVVVRTYYEKNNRELHKHWQWHSRDISGVIWNNLYLYLIAGDTTYFRFISLSIPNSFTTSILKLLLRFPFGKSENQNFRYLGQKLRWPVTRCAVNNYYRTSRTYCFVSFRRDWYSQRYSIGRYRPRITIV